MNKEFTNLNSTEILITGGSGSLGSALTKILLKYNNLKGLRLYSRSEYPQWELKEKLKNMRIDKNVSFLIGDVRDYKRLRRAMQGVDIVLHLAAMKQIPFCEENPFEAIETNINGSKNVIDAALDTHVKKVIFVSTDKSVEPRNLYGATKMCSEIIFKNANTYSGGRNPIFSCCRYGNVLDSRGSIIPLIKKQMKTNSITLTHKNMTRFWITLPEVACFLLSCISLMKGGEIFIPKMKTARVIDVIKLIAPNTDIKEIGIRQGEKLHEVLITEEESKRTKEFSDRYIIYQYYENDLSFIYTSEITMNEKENIYSLEELKKKLEEINITK